MDTKVATDVRQWIYDMTKHKVIGSGQGPKGLGEKKNSPLKAHGANRGNFDGTVTEPCTIMSDAGAIEIPAGSTILVYHNLIKNERGGWLKSTPDMLAAIFIGDPKRPDELIRVRMNGKVSRQRF